MLNILVPDPKLLPNGLEAEPPLPKVVGIPGMTNVDVSLGAPLNMSNGFEVVGVVVSVLPPSGGVTGLNAAVIAVNAAVASSAFS